MADVYMHIFKFGGSFDSEFRTRLLYRIDHGLKSQDPTTKKAASYGLFAIAERQNRQPLSSEDERTLSEITASTENQEENISNFLLEVEGRVKRKVQNDLSERKDSNERLEERYLLTAMKVGGDVRTFSDLRNYLKNSDILAS